MINLTTYKLMLVKDTSCRYELDTKKIGSPKDAYSIIKDVFTMETQPEEILALLVLNTKNVVIACHEVSRGSINSSIVHPREVFKRALLSNGASIILAHNHPSGDPTPSKEDISITIRLKECGKILGIEVIDHVICGDGCFVSFKERGLL